MSRTFSKLSDMADGFVTARVLQAAVQLGFFDALKEQARDAAQVASLAGTDPRATELLLNALVALGVLEKTQSIFTLNEFSEEFLVSSSPCDYSGMLRFDALSWNVWGKLEQAVRHGKPVRAADMYQEDAHETEIFIGAMDSLVKARGDAKVLGEVLDLDNVRKILDVGPGPATYVIQLCRDHPLLEGTLFDLEGTMRITERYVGSSDVRERIRCLTGDYRSDPIPGRYDLVFLSNIIHSEGSEENRRLIKKLHANLYSGGRLVLKDHILDDSLVQPRPGALFALLMLLTTNSGRCYSFDEVRTWLEEAGYVRIQRMTLPAPLTSDLVLAQRT